MLQADKTMVHMEIHEYLKNIGNFKDGYDNQWIINTPAAAFPNARRQVTGAAGQVQVRGGDFGMPIAANHNLYVNAIPSPYTTASSSNTGRNAANA